MKHRPEVSLREAPPRQPTPTHSACLSDDQVLAFSEGDLSRQQRREVDRHVDGCSLCRELVFSVATARTSSQAVARSHLWNCCLQPDQVVADRYRIEHFVARGGMGEIYRAHDLETKRALAIKTLLATTRDGDADPRLAREASLGLRVSHDHVCRTYGHGVHRAHRRAPLQFMTMELIEGPRLGQLLKRRALDLPEVLRLAHQLLAGLAAIHAAGVLHLDFKSDNIVLRGNPRDEDAVIIDFGLSRDADAQSSDQNQPLVGTLSYMAPEQALATEPSTHSDVFSFGVVLFEMLTGRLPFEVAPQSPAASIVRRLLDAPPRPSTFARGIPPALDAFVVRCLAGARRERFRDGREALEGFIRRPKDSQDTTLPRTTARRDLCGDNRSPATS